MKNLFDVINPKMFSVFARDDRRSNYEILSMIYRLYTRDGLSDTLDKDDIHFALMRYFQTHVFDDLEDENGISINNASIREKARIKVRQFKKAGWLEEDNTEGFRTTIGLNDCALAMLELFDEMVDRFDRPLEYSGYFYTIYSLLLDFNDYKQSKARLEQVFTNTRYLFNGLQGLNSSIKRFIQQLMDDNQSTPEVVLHNLLVKYREQVLVTVFNNLKSKDSPDRYVSFILDKLRKIRYEDFDVMFEGYLASLNEVPLPDRELALKEELIEKLDDTIDRFMAVDGFVNAIDARNTKYHDAALSKIKFLKNNGRDITGLVDNALKSLKIEGRVPDYGEVIPIYCQETLDEESLYVKPFNRKKVDATPASKPVVSLEELQRHAAVLFRDDKLSKEEMNRFVKKALGHKKSIEAWEIPTNNLDDIIRLLMVQLYSGYDDMCYSVVFEEKTYTACGYILNAFTINKKEVTA